MNRTAYGYNRTAFSYDQMVLQSDRRLLNYLNHMDVTFQGIGRAAVKHLLGMDYFKARYGLHNSEVMIEYAQNYRETDGRRLLGAGKPEVE